MCHPMITCHVLNTGNPIDFAVVHIVAIVDGDEGAEVFMAGDTEPFRVVENRAHIRNLIITTSGD